MAKTFYQIYSRSNIPGLIDIVINDQPIKRVPTVKYLGVLIDENLKFKSHVNKVSGVISRNIGIISRASYLLNQKLRLLLYNAIILPYISYCNVIWGSNYVTTLKPIITQQKRAIRLIAGVPPGTHSSPLFKEMKLLKLLDLHKAQLLHIVHDSLFARLPPVIGEKFIRLIPSRTMRTHAHFSEQIRNNTGEIVPNYHHFNYRLFSLFCCAPRIWNEVIVPRIPLIDNIPPSKHLFKKCIKIIFTDQY